MSRERGHGGRRIHALPAREDVERELGFHLAMREQELVESGWERSAARAEAQRLFGDYAAVRGECTGIAARQRRSRGRLRMWGEFVRDLQYAARGLRRQPGFTVLAVLTLALGIGATTAAFALVSGVLLAPLPYPEPGRLVAVYEVSERGSDMRVAWPNFEDWQARAHRIDLAAHSQAYPEPVLGTAEPLRPLVAAVSASFFRVLGVAPALGRTFVAEELVPGGRPAVVVSDAFWRQQLGSERDLSRLALTIMGVSADVVGVMPRGFSWPAGAELWYPIEPHRGEFTSRTAHNFDVIGRLAPGAAAIAAQAELTGVMRRIRHRDPHVDAAGVAVYGLHDSSVGESRRSLLILLAASGFVLLVACTNLAGALLARSARRGRELAVRASLGAPRLRLVRQLLTESLLLAILGAIAGLLLAHLLVDAVRVLAPDAVPRLAEVRIDIRVLLFTTAVTVATALAFGTGPALRATAAPPHAALVESGRSTQGRRQRRIWSVLVGAETAMALLLLVGAGLLIRSFWNVVSVDPGFDADGVLAVTVSLPQSSYPDQERVVWYDRALAEVRAVPGVEAVALTRTLPLVGADPAGAFEIEGAEPRRGHAQYRVVSPDFFTTMRVPLLRGRFFSEADQDHSHPVVIINERLARRYFPDGDPIGRRISTVGMDRQGDVQATIIGIVGDVHAGSVTAPPPPAYYLPHTQRWGRLGEASLVVRGAVPLRGLAPAIRARIGDLAADVPAEMVPLPARIAESVADRRFTLLVLGAFAAVALVLAAVGIYAVIAFAVAQRTREIGIRVALGAEARAVVWSVSRTTALSAAAGILLGLAGAFALTRLLASLLFEVEAFDPPTFAAVAALLAAVAGLAMLLPARRAARVDPLRALNTE